MRRKRRARTSRQGLAPMAKQMARRAKDQKESNLQEVAVDS